ncbi:MAG: hypothetical protein WAW10_11145 [Gallionella sp.]
MKIYSAMLSFTGVSGIYKSDAIQIEGVFWLVPYWIENIGESNEMPVRIIRFDSLPHQIHIGSGLSDITINIPISKDVYDGLSQPTKESGLVVIENPDIPIQQNGMMH